MLRISIHHAIPERLYTWFPRSAADAVHCVSTYQVSYQMISCRATRIAPTPSGFLHIGNVLSFAVTSVLARRAGATVWLRIDDIDRGRVRREYINDIFETLRFLDIPWDCGPADSADFESQYSQRMRSFAYEAALDRLREQGDVFGCECSRTSLEKQPCECRGKSIPLNRQGVSWRVYTPIAQPVRLRQLDGTFCEEVFPREMQDFVVRKKDGCAAYQLASVCDDALWNIDLVVRGHDLLPSSLAQCWLASRLGMEGFQHALFHHHPLLKNEVNAKLSKSAGAESVHYLRQQGWPREAVYALIGEKLALDQPATDWYSLGEACLDIWQKNR